MGNVMVPGGRGGEIPAGAITLWSGAINAIPTGWALCNGANGTPDLRGRFVVGAGGSYAVGANGGAETVTLTTEQMPAHSHAHKKTESGGSGRNVLVPLENVSSVYSESTTTGGSRPHENRPPYYALCYIMKL